MDTNHKLPNAKAPDWSKSRALRDVIQESDLHDFLLESIQLDVNFCAEALLSLRVPPSWFGVESVGWTDHWPYAHVRLSKITKFTGTQFDLLDDGPAEIAGASIRDGVTNSVIEMAIRGNRAEQSYGYDEGVSIEFSFSGDAVAAFSDRDGRVLEWPATK
ncbi:MAG: hypothetical protein JNL19_08320 [Burkholderiales bacterium]|nr:hypothetical protein [Burkholderiales bacterium]